MIKVFRGDPPRMKTLNNKQKQTTKFIYVSNLNTYLTIPTHKWNFMGCFIFDKIIYKKNNSSSTSLLNRSEEGPTLETLAFKLLMVANLRFEH